MSIESSQQFNINVNHSLDEKQLKGISESVYHVTLEAIEQARKDSKIDSDLLLNKASAYKWLGISAESFERLLALGLPRGRLVSERTECYSKSDMRKWLLNK